MLAPHAADAPPPSWIEERIERLKQLWADGLSASQIANELGGLTRSAVLGKVHRLHLAGRKTIVQPKPGDKPLRVRVRYRHTPRFDPPEKMPETIIKDDADIPLAQRKTLVELTARSCRWPVGDPHAKEFFFCGGNRRDDISPYCAGHMRRATRKAWENWR